MNTDAQAFAGIMFVAVVLGIVVVACWIILPFAIIGTKALLRDLLREQRRTNELLERLTPRAADTGAPGEAPGRFTGSRSLPPT